MSTSIIDLPGVLQPETFLKNLEGGLSLSSLELIEQCKEVDDSNLSEAMQDIEVWWNDYGDRLGAAVALLWLANYYWKNWKSQQNQKELQNIQNCCNRALGYAIGPAPVVSFPEINGEQQIKASMR